MEGSESERLFKSLNLNPRILVNEVLNTVENLLDEAFDFYHQEASTSLNITGTDHRSQHLSQGIDKVRNLIQSNAGRRLGMWQEYCFRHCFAVPQGLMLPQNNLLDESCASEEVPDDADLDAQLDSLRERLTLIGKENAEMNRELQELERHSVSGDTCAALVNEALQLYEQKSADNMLQDMVKTASELRIKLDSLRMRKSEESGNGRTKRLHDPKMDFSTSNHGLSNAKLEDLQQLVADLKKM